MRSAHINRIINNCKNMFCSGNVDDLHKIQLHLMKIKKLYIH
jgi:hypothetical protein